MFYDILERKNASTDFIKKSSRSRKIGIFSKGLVHCFGQKLTIFPCFFLGKTGQGNSFYDILEKKKRFSRLNM